MFDRDTTTIRRLKRSIKDLERRVAEQHAKSVEFGRALVAVEERTRSLQEVVGRLELRILTLERRLWNFALLVAAGLSLVAGLLIAAVAK